MKHTTEGVEFVQLETRDGIAYVNPEQVTWVHCDRDDSLKTLVYVGDESSVIHEPLDTVLAKLRGDQLLRCPRFTPADENTEPLKIFVVCPALDWHDFVRELSVLDDPKVHPVIRAINDQLALFGSILKEEIAERENKAE